MKPFSLGSKGSWAIAAEGANAIAAFAHFDGSALWVISTSAERPALIDGRPVPASWVVVPVPSVLSFGGAEIIITEVSDEPKTHVISRRPPVLQAPARVYDVTKVAPLVLPAGEPALLVPSTAAPRTVSAPVRPPSLSKFSARDETRAGPRHLSADATRILPGAVLGVPAKPKRSNVLSAWQTLPLRRRAIAVLFPLVLLTVVLHAKNQSRGPASDRRSPAVLAASNPSATSTPAVATSSPAVAAPDAPSKPAATAPALPLPKESTLGKSLEREAADAVAAGDDAQALALYAALSSAYPERAEFSEAHSILERRARLTAPTSTRQ